MKSMLTALTARFRRDRQARPAARKPVRLGVEGLEARDCPTTIAAYATALVSQVNSDINQLVLHSAVVEYFAPTLLSNTIDGDLGQLYHDTQANAPLTQKFADVTALGQHMSLEASWVQNWGLPSQWALANNNRILSDLASVGQDKEDVSALINWVVNGPQSAANSLWQPGAPANLYGSFLNPPTTSSPSFFNAIQGLGGGMAQPSDLQAVDNIYNNYMHVLYPSSTPAQETFYPAQYANQPFTGMDPRAGQHGRPVLERPGNGRRQPAAPAARPAVGGAV